MTKTSLEKYISYIIKKRIAITAILVLLIGFSGFQTLQKLSIDNSLGIWFLEDDPSYKAYINFQETYGSDEIIIVMLPMSEHIEKHEFERLNKLSNELDGLSFVKTTYSIHKAKYPYATNNELIFEPLYNNKRSEKSHKKLWADMPEITQQLVSPDYKNLFLYIQLNPTPSIEKQRKNIAEDIETIIKTHYKEYHITGPPILNEAYNKGIYKESLLFGLLTVVAITLMLLIFLPAKRYLMVALCSVAAPISILFGIISGLGFSLNMISMLIPTILMVYSVSDVVHIVNIYHKETLLSKNTGLEKRLANSFKKSFIPCLLTTLTTVVGYFALYLSPLPAFKNMGLFTCIGLILSYVLVYLISIIGISFISSKNMTSTNSSLKKMGVQSRFLRWINKQTSQRKTALIAIFTLLLLFGLNSIRQIKVNTDSLNLLAAGIVKEDLFLIEQQLHSSSRLQLNVTTLQNKAITNKVSIEKLSNFQNKLLQDTLITSAVSIVNYKDFLEKRTPLILQNKVSNSKIDKILNGMETKENEFFKLFSNDRKTASITLSLPQMKTSSLEQLIFRLQEDFKSHFNSAQYKLEVNGFAVVFSQLNNFILETQFKSFFAAFVAAFICVFLFVKDLKTTFLVILPNIMPLAVLAIIMNLFHIPLDVTTAMITPIMLGIAMDDTIHLIYKYKLNNKALQNSIASIDQAVIYTGSALISTTIALVAGFLIIASSAVPSVRSFGLLCAITVVTALITDLFYLPALLKRFNK